MRHEVVIYQNHAIAMVLVYCPYRAQIVLPITTQDVALGWYILGFQPAP